MHKRINKFFILSIFLLFSFILKIIFPVTTYASELVGTHLGEGDVGAQINIVRNILIPNGLEPGSPVTVMVPVTMLQDSQIGTVQQLADAVKAGGYFPIVRINGVCNDFTSETGKSPGQAVDMARAVFGGDALIVWGNEINNQEVECDDWSKYLSDYIQIEGRPNVSPSALDYYMGNPDFTVSKMFADTPGMEAIFNSGPRAANAYGCVGSNSADCDPMATNTQEVGYSSVPQPLYLTEFSLSPEGNSSDAPDTNIEKVLEFLENRAGETPAVKITPLVRNVCNSEGTWLIYVNGKLFTTGGTEVSSNCEGSGTGGNGYDLSIYPEYGIDETMFYLSPIKNVIDGPSSQRTVPMLRKELALQGYEPYCAVEGVSVEPKWTKDIINRYFELYPDGYKELKVDAVETLDFTNAKYPLWRDVSNKQFLLTSLEEYFGFRDVYETDPADSVLTSSPINSLLSEPQLCVQGWKNLVAQQLACERLEDPSSCDLLTRPIPDTSYTVATALGLLQKYDPNYREGRAVAGCADLVGGATLNDLGVVEEAEARTLKKVLINTPTYFDRAYRYGFVVAVVHSLEPETDSGNVANKIFNFFTNTTRKLKPRDEVLVAAFKLPDIGTNKGGGDDSGSQFWSDPLDLTRKVLSTKETLQTHEDVDRPAFREMILQNAVNAEIQNDTMPIYCYDGSFPGGTGTTSCKNELTKALVDIINGSNQGCGEAEPVKVITDLAGLDNVEETYGKVFNGDNGGQVMLNLFVNDKTHQQGDIYNPQRAETDDPAEKLQSLFTLAKDASPNTWPAANAETKVDFYVVYPMGFELLAVEKAMKGAFFTKEQIDALDQDPSIIDGFEMTGMAMGLAAGSDSFDFNDYKKQEKGECGTTTDPLTGAVTNNECNKTATVSVKQEGAGVGVLGGRFGFWMRNVQKALNARESSAWKYFDSCKTTEEFLLGKCTGGNFGQEGTGENTGEGEVTGDDFDTLESVAQCFGGPRITSGETSEHIDTDGTGECTGKTTRLFVPDLHNIPRWKSAGDDGINCDDLYSYADCTYPESLIQNPVNSEGIFVESGNTTACEFVVSEAKKLGVSPRLALAMWGEESGFSHYRVPALGVIRTPNENGEWVTAPPEDLGAQVRIFARTLQSYDNYLSFLEAYSGEERGSEDPSPNQFCNNPNFVARLKTYYDYLGPW